MLTRSYKQCYTSLFQTFLTENTPGYYDEGALPSYTHNNSMMAWLFWKRIETSLKLAGKIQNQSVLDFGCGGGVTFKHLHKNGCRISGCESTFHEMAREVCRTLQIDADIFTDLFSIHGKKFDRILALDVLEHIQDYDKYIEKFADLSHSQTVVVLSGPTENILYKTGRWLAGFKGGYHVRDIYDIEKMFKEKGFQLKQLKRLYFPFTLFRISSWTLNQ